ncbi:MAG: NAD-dependent epimerase/dehydratase family protein [Oscillospiraceae bacterium]|nr:NAD-dependent epimerase/dehydratase family protein [Oscillospiraceae bacterium]
MKKILITGANSYIGMSFVRWAGQYADKYSVETIDMIDGTWREKSFAGFDAILHVAGIAHADAKADMREQYYKVNCDLAVETAQKAKADGVGQFVFMSSIILYGTEHGVIKADTVPKPKNFYGDSKLQADLKLHELQEDNFRMVSIRPPMIYGKDSKGNYPRLASLALKTPLFPCVKNQRSMLHIDNLCEFIRLMVEQNESGIFYPQNREYVNTFRLVCEIAKVHGKRVRGVRLLNPVVALLSKRVNVLNKLFGDLVYDKGMSDYMDFAYCVTDFAESIRKTEGQT